MGDSSSEAVHVSLLPTIGIRQTPSAYYGLIYVFGVMYLLTLFSGEVLLACSIAVSPKIAACKGKTAFLHLH